jgi:hypothetical protein
LTSINAAVAGNCEAEFRVSAEVFGFRALPRRLAKEIDVPSTRTTKPRSSKNAPAMTAPPVVEPQASAPLEMAMSDADKREVLIRIAAYSFYERRGYVCGHELEDWLRAEMEVDRQLAAAQEPGQTK